MTATRTSMARNVAARVAALVSLAVATVVIGRAGGPAAVGVYMLLRVVPSLVAVVVALGLPAALPYFLSGPRRADVRLRPTLLGLLVLTSGAAGAAWLLLVPVVGPLLFPGISTPVLVLAGVACATQLWLAGGRGWLQGCGDLRGGDVVIAVEEVAFLPAYLVLCQTDLGMGMRLVLALVAADLAVAGYAWWRAARLGFLRGCWGPPSSALAQEVLGYGARGQASSLLTVLNLRLDVVLLGALAGPAVVGTYAVASKYAELLRLPGLAATYVLYPAFSRAGAAVSATRVVPLVKKAVLLSVALGAPVFVLAPLVLNGVYGTEFADAVLPAYVLVAGLVLDAAAGVVVAWLFGAGRPGLTSVGAGLGLVVTVVLDVLLIPRYGAVGAAVASSVAYLTTALALWWCFLVTSRSVAARPDVDTALAGAS